IDDFTALVAREIRCNRLEALGAESLRRKLVQHVPRPRRREVDGLGPRDGPLACRGERHMQLDLTGRERVAIEPGIGATENPQSEPGALTKRFGESVECVEGRVTRLRLTRLEPDA